MNGEFLSEQHSTPEQPGDPSQNDGLSGRVARGAAWILTAGLFARVLGTLNTIIVARLLAPDDIGVVAVATVTMQLLHGFSDIGVSQAVVKFQNANKSELDTLFTLSVARGVILGLLLAGAAPLMADLYDEPRMFWTFLGISAFPIITGFINPRFYEFERDLSFSQEFISTILNKLAGVIVSVAVAFYFRTYWAIILGMLTGGVVQLFLSYLFRPHLPRFALGSLRKVLGFSGWLTGVSFMAALNNKLDVPIIARFIGEGDAGSYFMGTQLSEMVTSQFALPLTRAIYPGLSSLQHSTERMRTAFLKGVEALGIIAMPAAFGFAFVAEDLTLFLLGEKWQNVVPVVQILAPVIGVQSLFYAIQAYAISLGLTRLVFFREFIFFVVRFPLFLWATISYGIIGAIVAAAGAGIFHILLNLALYARASGRSPFEPLQAAWRSIAAVGAMMIYFLLAKDLIADFGSLPIFARLVADIATGGAVFFAAQFGLWRSVGSPDGIEAACLRFLRGRLTRFGSGGAH